MVLSTGNIPQLLWEGLEVHWEAKDSTYQGEYPQLFDIRGSKKAFEEVQNVSGTGIARVKPQGEGVQFDDIQEAYKERLTHVVYALGSQVTEEAIEDNQYMEVGLDKSDALFKSITAAQEVVCANVINNGWTDSAAYHMADGKPVFSTTHALNQSGSTLSNNLSVAAALAEESLENICIGIAGFTDDAGLKQVVMSKTLWIPKELIFLATRVLKSTLQNDTDLNAINALRINNSIPNGFKVNHYFTSASAYFVQTDYTPGLRYYNRRPRRFQKENDWSTGDLRMKADVRFSAGCVNPRAVYGTSGA